MDDIKMHLEKDVAGIFAKFNPLNHSFKVVGDAPWDYDDGRSVPACRLIVKWSGPVHIELKRELRKLVFHSPYEVVDDEVQANFIEWTVVPYTS